jgi:hypothetical protein
VEQKQKITFNWQAKQAKLKRENLQTIRVHKNQLKIGRKSPKNV